MYNVQNHNVLYNNAVPSLIREQSKSVERGNIETPIRQIHDLSYSWPDTVTSIKSASALIWSIRYVFY
jgi:hypothetical protein